MLRGILITVVLVVTLMLSLQNALQNGTLLRYLDENPNPSWVPAVEYGVGQGYALMQDLTEASTYFARIIDHYPDSPYAEEALFYYADSADSAGVMGRVQLIELYQKYIERYPNGQHVKMAQKRIDAYRTGVR